MKTIILICSSAWVLWGVPAFWMDRAIVRWWLIEAYETKVECLKAAEVVDKKEWMKTRCLPTGTKP